MTTLTYTSPPEIAKLVRKAADQWNAALQNLVALRPSNGYENPNIIILFGPIDRVKNPGRIAECRHTGVDAWMIFLADDEKWATSWWQRFVGNGHNALSALLHEFGHVFALPHAANPSFIMHPEIPNTNAIGRRERELYRNLFLTENDP